ncbi:gag-pol polyprotein [Striga asiatica]|uniref:Gag-pol polyprotein n=1 Tax=Striga asiatica TaxID=4170 RepID=A0A5A7P139_STRAF|nr:gag-pol polyprotein [Striga asiatica]
MPAPARPAIPSGAPCSVCGRTGHDSSRCFKVVPCPHCSRTGHNPKQCYELIGYPASSQQSSLGASSFSAGRGSIAAGAGHRLPPVAGRGRGRGVSPVQANATGVLPVFSSSDWNLVLCWENGQRL